MDDVLAGASIAVMTNWFFVSPIARDVEIRPAVFEEGGYGLTLDLMTGPISARNRIDYRFDDPEPARKRFRYEFETGPVWRNNNEVQAPSGQGDVIQMDEFTETDNNPTTTARGAFQWFLDEHNELELMFAPFEVKDVGIPNQPTTFNNVTFPAGVPATSDYRQYELRLGYRRNLPRWGRWQAQVGLGAAWFDVDVLGHRLADHPTTQHQNHGRRAIG